MAGKRQHYVPRLLQRGFLHNPSEEAERTWLHRRGVEPRLVGIRDVGVEDYFYSRPSMDGSPTLDDLITALEGSLSADVGLMRSAGVGEIVDSRMAAYVVVHLVTRTAHIRSCIRQALINIADAATERFTDPGYFRVLAGLDLANPSVFFVEVLSKILDDAPLDRLGLPRPLAERICQFIAREHVDAMIVARAEFEPAVASMLKDMSEQFRDAHGKALLLEPSDNAWVAELSLYEWCIAGTPSGSILSDCVAIVLEDDESFVPFMLANKQSARAIVLALTSDRLLVGRKSPSVEIDLRQYNEVAASCSEAFFIRDRKTDQDALADLIGRRPNQSIDYFINKAFTDLENRATEGQVGQAAEVDLLQELHSQPFNFQISFRDFDNAALVSKVSEIVPAVVGELSRSLPLYKLDGLTFAIDYPNALRNLDRGDATLPALETQVRGYGHGVARAVPVVRDGERKSHLVMQADIALGFLSTDVSDQRTSLAMLIKMLACVAHGEICRPVLEQHGPLPLMSWYFHAAVSQAPCLYFAAKVSAPANPDAANAYATLVVDGLACLKAEVQKERIYYRTSNDLDRLMSVAIPLVTSVLEHAAEWLGHRDGLGEDIEFSGRDLPGRLRGEGLEAWLELLGRDLRSVHGELGDRMDLERLYALDRHVERLLWIVQIFPWPLPEGGMYLSVPYGDDIEFLNARKDNDPSDTKAADK